MTRTSMDPELEEETRKLDAQLQPPATVARLRVRCAADVPPERVEWLWPAWLPFGKLVVIDGAPGIGKSTLVTDLIARVSRGATMPNSDERFTPCAVMIGGVEDGWADTVRPRLDSADADLSRVHFVDTSVGTSLTVPRDVVELVKHADTLGVRWLHLDSIMGTLDEDTNAYSDHEVRRALGPLKDAAERHHMLVTFVRHPRKAGGLAIHAGGGSVAFGALARVGLFVGLDPRDHDKPEAERRRVLARTKGNLSAPPHPLAFALETAPNGTAYVSWRGTAPGVTADELASPTPPRRESGDDILSPPKYAEETAWLRGQLADGVRVLVDTLKAGAAVAGLEWHRVKHAADRIGVSRERFGFPARGRWYLPTLEAPEDGADPADTPVGTAPPAFIPTVPTVPAVPTVPTETAPDFFTEDAA